MTKYFIHLASNCSDVTALNTINFSLPFPNGLSEIQKRMEIEIEKYAIITRFSYSCCSKHLCIYSNSNSIPLPKTIIRFPIFPNQIHQTHSNPHLFHFTLKIKFIYIKLFYVDFICIYRIEWR